MLQVTSFDHTCDDFYDLVLDEKVLKQKCFNVCRTLKSENIVLANFDLNYLYIKIVLFPENLFFVSSHRPSQYPYNLFRFNRFIPFVYNSSCFWLPEDKHFNMVLYMASNMLLIQIRLMIVWLKHFHIFLIKPIVKLSRFIHFSSELRIVCAITAAVVH